MIYCSVDIETTGLDPETCDVVEFAAVLADTEGSILDTFHCYVVHPSYRGEAYALAMHADIFRKIAQKEGDPLDYIGPGALGFEFRHWLRGHGVPGRVWPAGKNFGSFDLQFLKQLPGFRGLFRHRSLDPMMLYFDPEQDEELPDLGTCKARAGLPLTVAHTALEDALDVVQVLTVAFQRRKHGTAV